MADQPLCWWMRFDGVPGKCPEWQRELTVNQPPHGFEGSSPSFPTKLRPITLLAIVSVHKKTRRDCSRRVPTFVLAGPGAESARCQAKTSLAGDPSEVTALGVRHWITSFRC